MRINKLHKSVFILLFFLIEKSCDAQSFISAKTTIYPLPLNAIQQVDSIAMSKTISRYFAGLYTNSMKNIETRIESDGSSKSFMRKFEMRFAHYFLDACIAEQNNQLPLSSAWKTYFSNSNAEPWQLILMGVNAHVNIDLHKALIDEFSEREIRSNKNTFLNLQSAITKEYDPLFNTMMRRNGYLRFINTISFGLGKKFGERTLYKWRKRQIKLAILFYHNPKKYQKKYNSVALKKDKIDQLILASL